MLGTLGANVLGNLLTGTIRASKGAIAMSQGQGTISEGQDF